ncbi:MAG: hypothetical protein P1U36_03140 [Legionellaceae bacterium]|nr:hypothetical protein [Legionellaceae bacterium]
MPYPIAYLGTDTVETVHNYLGTPRGETLSYVMDRVLKPKLQPEIKMEHADDFEVLSQVTAEEGVGVDSRNRAARVYNGPVTDGSNLYDIMAHGVADMLPVIVGGEQVINIIGHSRGAVESIIASHELARIQKVLREAAEADVNSEEQLFELLCNSEHDETKEHLKKYLAPYAADLFANVSALRENMAEVEVNLFLLDPVPGGRVMGFSVAQVKDDRYYQIPAIVKDCREILLENERTRGFKAIVPHALDPQKTTFTLMNLPGHHGTASGNPYDQRLNRTEYSELKTKEVQDITLYALYDFFTAHGVKFDESNFSSDSNEVICNDLAALFENYRNADPQEKQNIKLATYAIILKNKSAYTAFNQTTYAPGWLLHGHEGSIQSYSTFGLMSLKHDRIIHVGGPGDSSLKSIVSFQSDDFVNAAHARLFLRKELEITEDQTPVQSLQAILNHFDSKMNVIHDIFSKDQQGKLTQTIKRSIQMMFSGLVQTYLRNNLSEEAKADILAVIERAINIELQLGSSDALTELVTDLKLYLVKNLSEDLHALTVSHQHDIWNLLGSDEQDLQIVDDKSCQIERFQTHLEVLKAYFVKFESVQSSLVDAQKILEECLVFLDSRRYALTKNREQYEAMNAEKKQLQIENSEFKIKNAQLRVDNHELLEENACLREINAGLAAEKVVVQQENSRIFQELGTSQADLESKKQRIVELEAGLRVQEEANSVLQDEKASVEGERDASQVELQESNTQLNAKNQRIADLEEVLESPDSDSLFQGLSLEILGVCALVLGSAVVALSLAILMLTPVAPIIPIGIALAGTRLATAGFFGMKQGILEQHQKELYKSTLEAGV